MRHPRRNEVYRDVGSEVHDRRDRDFIDVGEVAFEPDSALLLCSDGLTDLVDSVSIAKTVSQCAGDPEAVVRELIAAANAAGGKDNVTAVYVEGEKFAASGYGRGTIESRSAGASAAADETEEGGSVSQSAARFAMIALGIGITAAVSLWQFGWTYDDLRRTLFPAAGQSALQRTVSDGESITEALRDAPPGSVVMVEPGEYREQVTLVSGVRLISRVPGGAVIRLPAAVPDTAEEPAVIARNVAGAEIVNFRISGDAATPLPVGIRVQNSTVSILHVEISGATRAALEFAGGGASTLMASDIRDNAGAALVVRDGSSPRVVNNSFARNGRSDRVMAAVVVQRATPLFINNVFAGMSAASFAGLDAAAVGALRRDNWFPAVTRPSEQLR
jgi:hypothetical protein